MNNSIRSLGMRRRQLLGAAATAALGCSIPARADRFPARPVKIVLPQPAGGAADRLARILALRLEAKWNQSVVVENKPGGGVVIGTLAAARSAPDGYTFALLGSSLSINAVQRTDLPYDALKDLQPLARVGYYTVALLAPASFPANNVTELIALAKKQPGKLSFGSNGIGTSAQIAGEMLNHMGGIHMLHIPYNGAAKLYNDMVGGLVPLGFAVASSADAFIKAGQLKVLGVTSAKRSPQYPQWPTIAETLPGYEVVNWAGLCAPAGLPSAITQQLASDLQAVLAEPDVVRQIADMGIELSPQDPAAFAAFLRTEIDSFRAVMRPLTIK